MESGGRDGGKEDGREAEGDTTKDPIPLDQQRQDDGRVGQRMGRMTLRRRRLKSKRLEESRRPPL